MNEKSVAVNAMYGSLVEPLTQVNRFMVSQLEQGVMLGLDSLRAYVGRSEGDRCAPPA